MVARYGTLTWYLGTFVATCVRQLDCTVLYLQQARFQSIKDYNNNFWTCTGTIPRQYGAYPVLIEETVYSSDCEMKSEKGTQTISENCGQDVGVKLSSHWNKYCQVADKKLSSSCQQVARNYLGAVRPQIL